MSVDEDRAAHFRRLHESGCFVMPNPWDAGSARALEQFGFAALATTSAGFAWTLGRPDNHLSPDELSSLVRQNLKSAFSQVSTSQAALLNRFHLA